MEDLIVSNSDPVDAVITWVDGSDPLLQQRRLQSLGRDQDKSSRQLLTRADPTRYCDNGELQYCLASIRTFAPWIRRVFLVTDRQRPKFLNEALCKEYKVILVSHQDLFASYEWALPTFNNRSIETALWRIPQLSNKFIYFNDDFVLTKSVTIQDFFHEDAVVLRGEWRPQIFYGPVRMWANQAFSYFTRYFLGISRTMHLLVQMRSAQLAGFTERYFRVPHVPHPMVKSVLEEYFREHPQIFEKNIRHKFRSMEQFTSIYLGHHLQIARGDAELMPADKMMMIHGEMDYSPVLKRKMARLAKGEVKFLCLQGLEKMNAGYRHRLMDLLAELTRPV